MKQIYTCTSKIDGTGIRVGEKVKKGELIFYIKGDLKIKVNKSKTDALSNPDWIGIAKDKWIDPEKPYKFLNHSCNPNSGMRGKVSLTALRDIEPGEEITIDYSIIEGDPLWELSCNCGEKNCRKIIRSVQFIPKEQFDSYMPFVPKYFQKLFNKSMKQNSNNNLSSLYASD